MNKEEAKAQIRKLMGFNIKQATQAEVEEAGKAMQRLMARYNIQPDELKDSDTKVMIARAPGHIAGTPEHRYLARIVAGNFRCKALVAPVPQGWPIVCFFGLELDLQATLAYYELAVEFGESQKIRHVIQEIQLAPFINREETARTWFMGFSEGIATQFQQQVYANNKELGLMVLTPPEVAEAAAEATVGKMPGEVPPINVLSNAFQSGFGAGLSLTGPTKRLSDGIG